MNSEISLSKYLSRYYLFIGKDLTKLTHNDVKLLFPHIRRSSFQELNRNPKLLRNREVIFVNDGHNSLPYYTPKTIDYEKGYTEFIMVETKKDHEEEGYDYVSMSNYELKKLLNDKFNSRKNRMKAKQELEDRGLILKKKYNRCKDNKVEDYYGEY